MDGRPDRHVARGRSASGRAKSESRRAELVAIARRVFAEKGYTNATVRDVGDRAGILSGSLYYHFSSKDALLEEILSSALDDLIARYRDAVAGAASLEALERLLGAGFRWVMQERESATILHDDFRYLRTVEQFEFVNTKNREIKSVWIAALADAQASGAIRPEIDIALAYRMLMGSVLSVGRWFDPAGPDSADAIADRLTSLVLDGLTTGA
jgi:AcrR family transcriptional regulator